MIDEDRLKDENAKLREELAKFMMEHSFATGHGDTHADLLAELGHQIDRLRAELAGIKARYQPGMTDLMIAPEEIDEFLDNPLVHENLELLAELETARAYARHERDIGKDSVTEGDKT